MGLLHGNRLLNNKEQLDERIDSYFNSITKIVETNEINSAGDAYVYVQYLEPPTIYNMAKHCGMTYDSLLDYQELEGFNQTIKNAKKRIEAYNETLLYDKNSNTVGVIFNLKNNFNWSDRQQIESVNENINHNNDLKGKTSDEIAAMIADLKKKTK